MPYSGKKDKGRQPSEHRYKKILNAAIDPILVHDLQGRFIEANDAACKALGYTHDELCRLCVWDVETGVTLDGLASLWKILEQGPVSCEGRHRRKDDSSFPVEVRLSRFNSTGEPLILAMIKDISEKKHAEDQIRNLTRAVEQSPVLIIITDVHGSIEYINPKTASQTGYSDAQILGNRLTMFFSDKNCPDLYASIWSELTLGIEWRGEIVFSNSGGHAFYVSAIMTPLRNEFGHIRNYLMILEDISAKKSYQDMLKYQASYDNLTNLPNRFYGISCLEQAILRAQANGTMVAVFFIDLDEFKKINDNMGHEAGDALLQIIAHRFIGICRKDDIVVRLGGDEFMLIIDGLNNLAILGDIAQKFLEQCALPLNIDNNDMVTTASIGISVYPQHGLDPKTLMRNADIAMYRNKISGKNNWLLYRDEMKAFDTVYFHIKSEMFKAVKSRFFDLHYQPIMNIKSNQPDGIEVLIRWRHETLGDICPKQMISVAEETGLIVPIGLWVLTEACRALPGFEAMTGRKMWLAVNISVLQLKHRDFIRNVRDILKETGCPPEQLHLEITENILMDNSPMLMRQLQSLNDMNVRCTIDDFGTGYSSLSYLNIFPFHTIKIDRSFLMGLGNNENRLHMLQSIIDMGKKLRLNVVAEGVEEREQLDILRNLGCELIQGWYFARAMPAWKMKEWLTLFNPAASRDRV